jgi:hypothetical protein
MASYSITDLRKLLLNLGLRERATADLIDISREFNRPMRRTLAARELAVLHMAADDAADLRAALNYFDLALSLEVEPSYKRATDILRAEAHLRLGETDRAREILLAELVTDQHLDLYLGLANCESDIGAKVALINQALDTTGLIHIALKDVPAGSTYDGLTATATTDEHSDMPLITVIMPAYNSETFIGTAIRSLLAQTWRNIEVLIVDDCSTDATAKVVGDWAERDKRVRLIQAAENSGPYVARNLALREAQGVFVTCNDADDWSHPEKLALQARHLQQNSSRVANDSQQTRATEDLQFYRRGSAGWYTFRNMSSLMFRRDVIAKEIGFWDCVRFGADSEFINRINIVFGEGAAVSLPTGPVSFQRQSAGSLTAHSAFGYHGFHMGARLEYARQQARFHQTATDLKYSFPQPRRTFPVPEPMWPKRDRVTSARRFYDVVIVADYRVSDDTSWAVAAEVAAHAAAGLRTGLVQLSRYDVAVDSPMPDHIRRLLDHERTDVIVHGEKIDCDLAILRSPVVLQDPQVYFPDIDAKTVVVVAQSTKLFKDPAAPSDHLAIATTRVEQYFNNPVLWCAESPAVRDDLLAYRGPEGQALTVSNLYWEPILADHSWYRAAQRTTPARNTLGFHGIPGLIIDPQTPHRLTAVYSNADQFERQVLAKAQISANVMRKTPNNWTIATADNLTVAAFLRNLDVFLCYDSSIGPDRLRLLALEAMATGVPTVLDPAHRSYFGKAAAYAEPVAALALAFHLLDHPEAYAQQRSDGIDFIRKTHSSAAYLDRLSRLGRNGVDLSLGLGQKLIRSLDGFWARR